MKKVLPIVLFFVSFFFLSFAVAPHTDCSIMKQGTFTYGKKKSKVVVKIKEYTHTEYHNDGKFYMVSKIKWIDYCSYTATLVENTVPYLPIKVGTELTVNITKIKGNKISYTAGFGGSTWKGKYTKLSESID